MIALGQALLPHIEKEFGEVDEETEGVIVGAVDKVGDAQLGKTPEDDGGKGSGGF